MVKTKEFIKKAKMLGFEVREAGRSIIVIANLLDAPIITVRTDELYQIDSRRDHSGIDKKALDYLFNYTVDYARTPLEEREEEKKYIYRFPFHITARNVETKHICRNHTFRESGESNDLIIDLSPMDTVVTKEKFHFTDKEVEQYTGKDRALFNACEKIEVTSND